MSKEIVLTGDRPTGKLHLGHYIGSLKTRVELQNSNKYKMFIMIADQQALTDNADNPQKISSSILELMRDYLAVGLDPKKITFFIQSQIPALSELTMYYMNLVTLPRLLRNPTVKSEMIQKRYDLLSIDEDQDSPVSRILELVSNIKSNRGVPVGFAVYPISQAADITAFKATIVPVGVDQEPMIEQTREIVRSFNQIYGDTLIEPQSLLQNSKIAQRLPGIDGNAKMGKSLNNGIYLSDSSEILKEKIMKMYTDPDHIRINDPGKIEGNMVFTYLDVFAPNDQKVAEMKDHYKKGGLGDVEVKEYLFKVLEELLKPIREKRAKLNNKTIHDILIEGSAEANKVTNKTLKEVRDAIGLNYFDKI